MIVCISGASGLIGTALTSELRHRGATVRCLVRGTPNGEDEFEWLPSEDRLDQRAIEGVDAVVHLAGESIAGLYWSTSKKQRILESRVRSTHLLATALANAKQKPKVFLSASAVGYYGSRDAEEVNETSTSGDNFLAEVCRQWEAAAAPARAAGIRVVHPRTGIVLTKKGGALKQMLLPFRLGLGGRLGSGAQYVSWITLDDEVAALIHCIEVEAVEGPVNLVAPNPVTNAELTKELGQALRRPTLIPVPAPVVRLLLGEMGEQLLLAGTRVYPDRLVQSGYTFRFPTLPEALRHVLSADIA